MFKKPSDSSHKLLIVKMSLFFFSQGLRKEDSRSYLTDERRRIKEKVAI